MSQPPPEDIARRRIIVIVSGEPDALSHITGALAEAEVAIESIDERLLGELGVIVVSTSDDDAALRALLEANLRAITSDALVFHLPDRPGALAGVMQRFGEQQLNVRTIHIVHRQAGQAIVAVNTDDDATARTLLPPDSLL